MRKNTLASDPQTVLVLLYHDKPGNVGNPIIRSQSGEVFFHPIRFCQMGDSL